MTSHSSNHTIQQELKSIIAFIAIIWMVFVLECVVPFDLTAFGVTPRTLTGLVGIPAMPFLHANWQHITSNTLPLFVLLILLAGSKSSSWEVVAEIVLLGGLLLWLFGRHATHLGASGLVFGLIAFVIVSGWLERRFVPLMISLGVTFLYGGSLISGVMPRIGSHVSWDGHLSGAVAGSLIAFYLAKNRKPQAALINLMFVAFLGLVSNAVAEEAPAPADKQPKIEVPRIVIVGDFGDVVPENIVKVLESTAEQLLRQTPERRLGTILVSPSTDVPITLFAKGPANEYQIRLATRDRYWAQYAYQFAHEVCHVLCNYDRKRSGDKQWFEEALCETASLFALKRLATSWQDSPPYPNWKSFAVSFQHYVNDMLSRRDRRLSPDLSLPDWYRRNSETLRKDRQSTERTKLVATYLLSLFEDDPSGWQTLTSLNMGDQDAALPFPEYLAAWKSRCPERHRPFVSRVEDLFGLTTASTE